MSIDWIDQLEHRVRTSASVAHRHAGPVELAASMDPAYRRRDHLDYLSQRLAAAADDVQNRGINRMLTVSMPPRLGKSNTTSVWFPTWLLQQFPEWPIGLISHSPSLASSWGRQIRRQVEQFPELGIELARDAGAVTEWETKQGGGVISRSVGQSTTGLGFKVLLMDDVVRDFAAAHSESNRESIWDWWRSNSMTRLEPPYLAVAVGTRWHEDDFIGRLLSPEYEGDPDDWEQIRLPAIAETGDVLGRQPGDPLYSPLVDETREEALERWATVRRSVGTYAWSALYQQSPAPARGSIFDTDWWQFYDEDDLPDEFDRVLTSWDCAFKGTNTSDFVVGQRWGVRGADKYLLDQVRGRWTFTETISQMEAFIETETENLVEDKANGPAILDTLKRKIPGLIPINPTNSKEARARAVTPQIESGNVWLPKPTGANDWVTGLLAECQSFPTGKHDDQVDALTQLLARVSEPAGLVQVSRVQLGGRLAGW